VAGLGVCFVQLQIVGNRCRMATQVPDFVAAPSGLGSRDPTGKTAAPSWRAVNPSGQKYSTLPKFGFVVCVAHPGSSLRGDHVVVIFASRACGGRGSVGRESCGQGGLLSVSPRLRARRAALSGSSRQHSSGNVDNVGG